MAPPVVVRRATDDDYVAVVALRSGLPVVDAAPARVYVAVDGARVCGFALSSDTFFGRTFISHLFVDAAYRRQSLGSQLMVASCTESPTQRLFTSTNESNQPMHALLTRLGWRRAGSVDGLDDGDPEVFYYVDRP